MSDSLKACRPPTSNLLPALEALLIEGSVTGAARRLGLSPSAMSRTLARLRAATGDPLLVQAGRTLAPTPYAEALRERVRTVAHEALAVLSPPCDSFRPAELERTFTIRANEGFVAALASTLVAAITEAAPRVRLRFSPKPDKDAQPLREGQVDLEIGVAGTSAPEVRSRTILRDRFVGAARDGHPLLSGPITPERYAACRHVVGSRRGVAFGPVDEALQALGLSRHIAIIVPGFPDAIGIARNSDLVALAPRSCFDVPNPMTAGVTPFDLPVTTPRLDIAAMWHPRLDSDPAQRWLRETVIAACTSPPADRGPIR